MADGYDVFLSHNSADAAVVEEIAVRLEDAGLRPFLDRWDLIPGELWPTALERALAGSNTVAVFLGPAGMGPWHEQEKLVALVRSAGNRKKRVIPVLLPGAREEDLGGFLDLRTRVDLAESDGFARLVAGVTGRAPRLVKESNLGQGSSPRPDVPEAELLDLDVERLREAVRQDLPPKVASTRLPHNATKLFGRETELERLDAPPAASKDDGLARLMVGITQQTSEGSAGESRGTAQTQQAVGAVVPAGGGTFEESRASGGTNNQGATIGQQIIVYGHLTMGPTTVEPPASVGNEAAREEPKPELSKPSAETASDRRFILLALAAIALVTAPLSYWWLGIPSKECIPITNAVCMDSLEVSRAEFDEFWTARCSSSEPDPRICTAPHHFDPENHERLYAKNEAARLEQNAQCTDHRWAGDHPIVCVDWQQANAYCEWVGGRLPTIDEWSIAAGSSKYPWGDDPPTGDRVNGCGSECSKVELKGFPGRKRTPFSGDEPHFATAPVGSYPSTGEGFYDLAGNVWEWTSTPGQPRYPFPASLRDAASHDAAYLVVGGGWDTDQDRAHDFYADGSRAIPHFAIRRDNNLGFRCVRLLSSAE